MGKSIFCLILLIWIKLPKKKSSSVKTDKQVALLSLYILAILTGSYSLIITPADGLAFLISAIIENLFSFILFSIFFLKLINRKQKKNKKKKKKN